MDNIILLNINKENKLKDVKINAAKDVYSSFTKYKIGNGNGLGISYLQPRYLTNYFQ